MKKLILFNIIFITLVFSSEIKDKSVQTIKSFYQKEIKLENKKFSIPKKLKKTIQNKVYIRIVYDKDSSSQCIFFFYIRMYVYHT